MTHTDAKPRTCKALVAFGWLAVVFSAVTLLLVPVPASAGSDAKEIVELLNEEYSDICHAELTGWFTKTLKLDWTANTNRVQMLVILAAINKMKQDLYDDGVRYLQIPNDIGTYNVLDWKTGRKKTIRDRAPYYFK